MDVPSWCRVGERGPTLRVEEIADHLGVPVDVLIRGAAAAGLTVAASTRLTPAQARALLRVVGIDPFASPPMQPAANSTAPAGGAPAASGTTSVLATPAHVGPLVARPPAAPPPPAPTAAAPPFPATEPTRIRRPAASVGRATLVGIGVAVAAVGLAVMAAVSSATTGAGPSGPPPTTAPVEVTTTGLASGGVVGDSAFTAAG